MLPGDMVTFFVELAVMLSVALLCGHMASRLRFPAIIGELIGGIIIGPTVLGRISPGAEGWLFPASGAVFMGRDALVQVCLLFFLFFAGLEMNLNLIKKSRSGILLIDLDLMKTDMAMLIMGSATVNDLIGWSLFALILSHFASACGRLCRGHRDTRDLWGVPRGHRPLAER